MNCALPMKVKISGSAACYNPPEAIQKRLQELSKMEQTEEVKAETSKLQQQLQA